MAEKIQPSIWSIDKFYDWSKSKLLVYGNLSSDIAMGGGIPMGSMILVGGAQGLGKSTWSWQYAVYGNNLYNCPIFFFGPENRLKYHTLNQIRDLDKKKDTIKSINPPEIKDSSGDTIGFEKWPAEEWFEQIGTVIKNNTKSMIIVDSLGQLSSDSEMSEGVGYEDRGKSKKIESSFIRQYGDIAISNQHIVFLITQIIANTSGYGAHTSLVAANKTKFQSDFILWATHATKWQPSQKTGRILGHDINWKVDKSNIGPSKDIIVPLRYGYGIDNVLDTIRHSVSFGLISQAGAWFQIPFVNPDKPEFVDEISKDCIKLQGENKVWQWFLIRPKELKTLESSIRQKLFATTIEDI